MHIHWFPGHMTKALRMMSDELKAIDSIIYVLDARAPLSCMNSSFDAIIGAKPRLFVLNKSDLVPRAEAEKWRDFFLKASANGGYACDCILADSVGKKDAKIIVKKLLEINADAIARYAARGIKKTVRAMVIGVPNCGKSTLINSLLPQKRAITGNRPGVTRGKQTVSIDKYIDLVDSPGVLYPDFSDQKRARNLAIIGSIKDEIVDKTELACEVLAFLLQEYPDGLRARYDIGDSTELAEIIAKIAKQRGYLLRGGEADVERAALSVVSDFRKKYFGNIILERVLDDGKSQA